MAPVLAAIGSLGSFLVSNIGTVAQVIGTGAAVGGTVYSGIQQQKAANNTARQLQKKGQEEYAIAQRKAMESRRQKRLALGRAQAVAAASGGGTGDTVSDIMTGIEKRGEYNALTDMYNGHVMRSDLFNQANATREGGRQAMVSSLFDAAGTAFSGAGTIYSDYRKRRDADRAYQAAYTG